MNKNKLANLQVIASSLTNNHSENAIILGNFLDKIRYEYNNSNLNSDYFNKEPKFDNSLNDINKSYFVAMCHKLCREFGFKLSKWMLDDKYILDKPYFAGNPKGNLKFLLLIESPYEFRAKNIYVTANALERV